MHAGFAARIAPSWWLADYITGAGFFPREIERQEARGEGGGLQIKISMVLLRMNPTLINA
jgi:hypothetical protein